MSRLISLPVVLACCMGMCVAAPQRRTQRQAPPRPAYMDQLAAFEQSGATTRVVLRDGMRILVHEFHPAPVVSVHAHLCYGYMDEGDQSSGASDLLQRLMLRRRPSGGTATLAEDLQLSGAELHAAVDSKHTIYAVTAPAAQWKRALELHSSLLSRPAWSDKEFEEELGRLLAETEHQLVNEDEAARGRLLELAFPQDRSVKSTRLSPPVLRSLVPQKLKEYAARVHAPNRMILTVAGDVITSEVLTQVVKLYGKGPKGGPAKREASEIRARDEFRYLQVRADVPYARISLAFRVPSPGSQDYPAIQVLSAMLGSSGGSTFSHGLRERKKLAVRTEARIIPGGAADLLNIEMIAEAEDIDRCEIAALTDLEICRRANPDPGEMARAVALLETDYWNGLQGVGEKAAALATHESRGGWRGVSQCLELWRQVKPEDVRRAARTYLALENAVLVETLPVASEERNLTPQGIYSLLRDLLPSAVEQELAERGKTTQPALSIPDAATEFKASELTYPWHKASILRGPELYIREDHTQPLIHMGIYYPGGRAFESKENAGITALLLHSMLGDTAETSAQHFHRQLEVYGGVLVPVLDEDCFGFSLTILSRNIDPALNLLIEMLQAPKLTDDQIERKREILIARTRMENTDVTAALRSEMNRQLFPEHSYGLNALGSETCLAALTPDLVRSWYAKTVHLRKPIVVITGDTRGTSLAEYFVRNFSGGRFQGVQVPELFPNPVEKAVSVERPWKCARSLGAVGFQLPPLEDEDSYPIKVLGQYLSDTSPRFLARLQEKGGRALSFSINSRSRLGGGWIALEASTAPNDASKMLEALGEEVGRISDPEISYRQFRSALNSVLAQVVIRRQWRAEQVAELVLWLLAGRGLDGVLEYSTRLQEVRQEDLQEAARRFFGSGKAVTVVFKGTAEP